MTITQRTDYYSIIDLQLHVLIYNTKSNLYDTIHRRSKADNILRVSTSTNKQRQPTKDLQKRKISLTSPIIETNTAMLYLTIRNIISGTTHKIFANIIQFNSYTGTVDR